MFADMYIKTKVGKQSKNGETKKGKHNKKLKKKKGADQQDLRLVTGLIGCMSFGTRNITHLMTTVFKDCTHGANMQSSCILKNIHKVAMTEGHLAEEVEIGADNTPKETKNQVTLWFAVWLLCALCGTELWMLSFLFMLVGHTHNKLDRFFSRLSVILRGRDYFTVVRMLKIVAEHLRTCEFVPDHLDQVWDWTQQKKQRWFRKISGLARVHAIRVYRSNGIYLHWKQWLTDDEWSKPVLLVPEDMIATVAAWCPDASPMAFKKPKAMCEWLVRLQVWCAGQQGEKFQNLGPSFEWLRQVIDHEAPGLAPHSSVETILSDLRALPFRTAKQPTSGACWDVDRHICLMFPGADVPRVPADTLVQIDRVTHRADGLPIQDGTITHGSLVLTRVRPECTVRGHQVPFLVGRALDELVAGAGKFLVAWFAPTVVPGLSFRRGKQADVLDVFGPWRSTDEMSVPHLRASQFPDPWISLGDVLLANVDFTDDGTLPYWVFDVLRLKHDIDVTGLNCSRTPGGQLYHCYAVGDGRMPPQKKRNTGRGGLR